jgi:ComF family protein
MIRAVTKFKYSFVRDLTKILVELMASGINHPLLFRHTWLLVPVPLHTSRLKWRGFNQAESLAVGLGLAWHNPVDTTLVSRIKSTTPQMKLSGTKRKQNLKNAFKMKNNSYIPSHVLLVDDVATTCSTLNECAIALKRAGVKVVWGLTLAQKIPDKS